MSGFFVRIVADSVEFTVKAVIVTALLSILIRLLQKNGYINLKAHCYPLQDKQDNSQKFQDSTDEDVVFEVPDSKLVQGVTHI